MIDFYFAPTPNGLKLKLFFEETGLEHRVIPVSLSKGEQHRPEFLAISPNHKIPAIVDHAPSDGGAPLAMFESGAILVYLADKIGRLLPADLRGRAEVMQWLFWQMSALGPMSGQAGHFIMYAPMDIAYAIERYTNEVRRLYGVLDQQLADRDFIVGDYSIADIACYPWIVPYRAYGLTLDEFPHLARWFAAIHARPATVRSYVGVEAVYAKERKPLSDEERKNLFGGPTAPAR